MVEELPQAYLEYLKENVDWLERIGDKFSGIDERVDYVAREIVTLKEYLPQIDPELLDRLSALLLEIKETLLVPQRTEQIVFQRQLNPLEGVRLTSPIPITGKMTAVTMHFPDGCNSLVDIAVGYLTKQLVPLEDYIALNNATPVFVASEPVKKDDECWCEILNGDAINAHTISVIVTVQGG